MKTKPCSWCGLLVLSTECKTIAALQEVEVFEMKKSRIILSKLLEKGHFARIRHMIRHPKTRTVKAELS